jgi:hypothetical protein|tara:strand:+ start:212 stop:787 length:576 start_codon:yes stop_codon:yes gene_type:complete
LSKRLDIFISVCIAVVLGTSGFYAGIYYGFMKSEEYVETLLDDFEKISSDVAAFKKVSDPATIQEYVRQLNKILDDINFLDNLVQTGQIASGALDDFFEEYQGQLDDVNTRIVTLNSELRDVIMTARQEITNDATEYINDNVIGMFEDQRDETLVKIGELYDKIDLMHKDLESITKTLDKIKNSKLAKYLN